MSKITGTFPRKNDNDNKISSDIGGVLEAVVCAGLPQAACVVGRMPDEVDAHRPIIWHSWFACGDHENACMYTISRRSLFCAAYLWEQQQTELHLWMDIISQRTCNSVVEFECEILPLSWHGILCSWETWAKTQFCSAARSLKPNQKKSFRYGMSENIGLSC